MNYLGHWENVDLGGKGNGLSFTFTWGQGTQNNEFVITFAFIYIGNISFDFCSILLIGANKIQFAELSNEI